MENSIFGKWWSDEQEKSLKKEDYSGILQEFDFIHSALPEGNDYREKFINFYLGNGTTGMIIDAFGAQSVPYLIDSSINYETRDANDSRIGVARSDEFHAEPYIFMRNTFPVINTIDNWSAIIDEDFKNKNGRGKFSMRCIAFPTIDGHFDVTKVHSYSQRLELWNNKCITRFRYGGDAEVTVTSFVSWDSKRLTVYHIKIKNLSDKEIQAGSVTEPVVCYKNQRLQFANNGRYQMLEYSDPDLLYDTAVCAGVDCDNGSIQSEAGKYIAKQVLKPGESFISTTFFIMQNASNHENPGIHAGIIMDSALEKGYTRLLFEHEEKVHEYWRKWWILLPWKELCKVYYRNAAILGGQLNGGKWYPAISTLASSSYNGGGWGMDNVPIYDFMMQTGHTEACRNIFNLFAEVLPKDEENYGSQFNYCFDNSPLSGNQVCNCSGNYAWLMYEYYKYTGDDDFLVNQAYPVMRSMCNFWSGYAGFEDGRYGFWTRKEYQGVYWETHTYDEKIYDIPQRNYRWGEIDNPIDAIAPAKCIFGKTIELAKQLGLDGELIPRWEECQRKLEIPQNEEYYLTFIGCGYHDEFPNRHVMSCAQFNTIYPTICDIDRKKLERTYIAFKENNDTFEWYFNYNQQLWAAAGRMRMPQELQWLMVDSKLNLSNSMGFDDMTMFENNPNNGAVYFMMPYAMINVTVNEMLLQSYDGVIRVFPSLIPALSGFDAEFDGLAAFHGFTVSAKRQNGNTGHIILDSELGGSCRVEMPESWKSAKIMDLTNGACINAKSYEQTIYLNYEEAKVLIIEFETSKHTKYLIEECSPV